MFRFWREFMAELDDLKAAVSSLATAVSDASAELNSVAQALLALKGQAVISPADVEAIAVQAQGLATSLETAVATTKTATGV
jgi:hypothetical protein